MTVFVRSASHYSALLRVRFLKSSRAEGAPNMTDKTRGDSFCSIC
ncbi:gp16 [Corynebacterium phage P1201]|uniref:Gp14 n=1 Tax=Corynebacterium phage P1201 TaxID=384848 RepID=A7IY85_9CAUD|nr:gp14 [Corynebacterium phage P1201]YP_001468917.1 gp15 [Corynebacterium phage P1201]YP_001468918.1 gp16 [Corynebacterium phage P1201]ABF57468.1 gp14 [Corynebacterium phage P1201]ABF57469.1 gp15 [Corynebacterium phage P1201]ABF57470.1 gp16 [Corynebacterium phage P1201]